jgi:hypothetical protein
VPSIAQTISQHNGETTEQPLLEAIETGIKINYFLPSGATASYKPAGNKWGKSFFRVRFLPEIEKVKGRKYDQQKGSGIEIFITPKVFEAFRAQKKISRLVFVEGEFKALALDAQDVYAVGILGIHGYGDSSTKDPKTHKLTAIHPSITQIVQTCEVSYAILLFDADCFALNFDVNEAKTKDWQKRPFLFYTAVKKFSEFMQPLVAKDTESEAKTYTGIKQIRFKAIRPAFAEVGKGIDDLLAAMPENAAEIVRDITVLQKENKYITGYNATTLANSAERQRDIKEQFGLLNVKNFYTVYGSEIKYGPFRYQRAIYQFDGHLPKIIAHDDGQNFMRVEAKWYKKIAKVNRFGELETEIKTWTIEEIKRDYENKYGQLIPGFIQSLKRYETFTVWPDFTPKYKRVIHGNYNLSNPLPHTPRPGSFPHINQFLKHIFSASAKVETNIEQPVTGHPLTVFVDWLNLALAKPRQKLCTPILVSQENKTGKKTTLLEFCCYLFGTTNSTILNNEQFKTQFNAHYITRHFIGIDEGFVSHEKRSEKEKLKQLITANETYLQHKGVNLVRIPYFSKIIMTGNDENRIIQLDEGEDRWFVVKVPQFTEENPILLTEMRKEIPAFLHFLFHREIHHPQKTRFWFDREMYITQQFNKIVSSTKTMLEQNIDELIKELFWLVRPHNEQLEFDTRYILDALKNYSKYPADASQIRSYVGDKRGCIKAPNSYHKMPYDLVSSHQPELGKTYDYLGQHATFFITTNRNCSPYIFEAKDWLSPEDYTAIYRPPEANTGETPGQMAPPPDPFTEQMLNPPNNDELPF